MARTCQRAWIDYTVKVEVDIRRGLCGRQMWEISMMAVNTFAGDPEIESSAILFSETHLTRYFLSTLQSLRNLQSKTATLDAILPLGLLSGPNQEIKMELVNGIQAESSSRAAQRNESANVQRSHKACQA